MAANTPDSSSQVSAEKEEVQTALNDDKAINAPSISFCMPEHYYIEYEKVVIENPTKETQSSCGEYTSKPRRKRREKELPEWIINWEIHESPRRCSSRIDKTYRHKEKGFVCRSLLEAERYEKFGVRPGYSKKKTGDKGKGKTKIDDEAKEMVMTVEKEEQAISEEMLVAERKKDAESQRPVVEEFLSKAYHNLVHMFDP